MRCWGRPPLARKAACADDGLARQWLAEKGKRLKFSEDAMLAAAATIVAGRIQAQGSDTGDASQMLVQAMTEVLTGIELMEDQAKTENIDLWSRLTE